MAFVPNAAFAQKDKDVENEKQRGKKADMQRPNPSGQLGGNGQGGIMGPGQGLGMMAKFFPIMVALDTDQDGILSASEIENASKALLKLDKDGDGVISAEELRPDPSKMPGMMAGAFGGQGGPDGQMGPEMMLKMFASRDKNGDGKLSGDEIPERMRERLAKIDKNGDGAIQKSELEAANAMFGDRAGQRPGQGKDNDGSGVKPKRPGQ